MFEVPHDGDRRDDTPLVQGAIDLTRERREVAR